MPEKLRLLVVEDEPLLRHVLEDALIEAGFEVDMQSSGAEALTVLEQSAGAFAAVVTDINLGSGPSGWDLGRRARELVSALPLVYMSGDKSAEWTSRGVPGSVFVPKPFVPAQIVMAVSTLLNTPDTPTGT